MEKSGEERKEGVIMQTEVVRFVTSTHRVFLTIFSSTPVWQANVM